MKPSYLISPGKHLPGAVLLILLMLSRPALLLPAGADSTAREAGPSMRADTAPVALDSNAAGRDSLARAESDSIIRGLMGSRSAGGSAPFDFESREPDPVFSVKNISYILIVLGLLVLFLHLLRKVAGRGYISGSQDEHFRVVRQFPLGPKKSVSLVRFGDRLLLLGVTESSVNTLLEIDDPDEAERLVEQLGSAASPAAAGQDFRKLYRSVIDRVKK